MHEARIKQSEIEKSKLIHILASKNFNQLRAIFNQYKNISGHEFEDAINVVYKDDIKDALLAIIKNATNQHEYFAELIYNSMKVCF